MRLDQSKGIAAIGEMNRNLFVWWVLGGSSGGRSSRLDDALRSCPGRPLRDAAGPDH